MRTTFIVCLACFLFAAVASAQTVSITIEWPPNQSSDNVTGYNLYLDGLPPVLVPATTTSTGCVSAPCVQTVQLVAVGPHQIFVKAINTKYLDDPTNAPGSVFSADQEGGPGPSIKVTVNQPPGKPGGPKVKK